MLEIPLRSRLVVQEETLRAVVDKQPVIITLRWHSLLSGWYFSARWPDSRGVIITNRRMNVSIPLLGGIRKRTGFVGDFVAIGSLTSFFAWASNGRLFYITEAEAAAWP